MYRPMSNLLHQIDAKKFYSHVFTFSYIFLTRRYKDKHLHLLCVIVPGSLVNTCISWVMAGFPYNLDIVHFFREETFGGWLEIYLT